MVVATCTSFSHYNNVLPSRSSTDEVSTTKFPTILDSFFSNGLLEKNLSEKLKAEPDQVIGHSGLKTD